MLKRCSRAGCRRSIPGPWRWRRAERPGFQASSPVRCRAHLQRPTPCGFVDETWMANGAMLRRVGRPASIGPLSTLHPYQEDSHRRVEYRRSTKVDKAQGQAPIPQGAWRSTICEDPPPKNKKQPQRQSPKPRREASARNPPSQESHPIPSLLCLFSSRRD